MVWAPGQSGNPGGRPRKKPFLDAINRQLKTLSENGVVSLDDIASNLIKRSLTELACMQELANRLEGRPPTPVVGDDNSDPITVRTIVTGVPRSGDE